MSGGYARGAMHDRHVKLLITAVILGLLIYWGVTEKSQPTLIPLVTLILGTYFLKGNKEEDDPKPKKPVRKHKTTVKQKDKGVADSTSIPPSGDYMVQHNYCPS